MSRKTKRRKALKAAKVETMPTLNLTREEFENQKQFLFNVLSIQSKTRDEGRVRTYVRGLVDIYNDAHEDKIQWESDRKGNIYLTKGVAVTYPTVVAHIDTVHSIIPDDEWYPIELGGNIFALNSRTTEKTGIGGDDKVGVFVALTLLLTKPTIKVALFVEEESGCIGSKQADMNFFIDSAFVMQTDRRDYGDFVRHIYGQKLYGEEFARAIGRTISKYNFRPTNGGLTDVYQLVQNGCKVAVFNCSSGYYNPHTSDEYVVVKEALLVLQMFEEIIETAWSDGKQYVEERELSDHRRGYRWGNSYNQNDFGWGNSYQGARTLYSNGKNCPACGRYTVYDWELHLSYCPNCDDHVY